MNVLFLTDRGERHQRAALAAAPPGLMITMFRGSAPDASVLRTTEILITERNQPVTAAMIAQAPNLKFILRLGSLWHDIDLAAARAANIRVSAQPVLGVMACAEHALLLILALTKRLHRSLHAAADHGQSARRTDENTFAFNWLAYSDIGSLVGQTVSILGMGEIGAELARRLRAFRPGSVLYHKRTPYPPRVESDLGVHYAEPESCLFRADVLVTLLPYTPLTDYRLPSARDALTRERLALLKPTAFVVGLGSGSVIDESALADMCRAGKIAGVALDTYEYEPLQPDHPLVALARDPASNVLLTPHTAAVSPAGDRREDYAEIVRFLAGQPLQHAVL